MSGWSFHRIRNRIAHLATLFFSTVLPAVSAALALALGAASVFFNTDRWFKPVVLACLGACLGYLVLERHYLERAVKKTTTVSGPFFDSDPVHRASAGALGDARAHERDDRVILITTLPGHSAKLDAHFEYGQERTRGPGLSLLMKELEAKILSPDEWHVRHIVNITSFTELEEFMTWLARVDKAPAYEVRAYCTHESLPIIAPLVVGRNEVLLGVEDIHKYELKNAIRIEGREVASWATEYFDDLWEHATFRIRIRRGPDSDGLQRLQQAILADESAPARADVHAEGI